LALRWARVRALAEWLAGTPLTITIQSTLWFIRLLQATHLLAAGVAAATGILIALRVVGWHRADVPFEAVWKRFGPWLAGSCAVMLATGIGQTLGDPVRAFTATSYWVKLVLLVGATVGTLALARAGRRARPPADFTVAAKIAAVGIILCWLAIPLLGRMIAYDRAIWGGFSLRS
jgi:hypothetical protein